MFVICCFVGLFVFIDFRIRKCHIDRHKALQLNDEIDACSFDSERHFRTAFVVKPPPPPSSSPWAAPHRSTSLRLQNYTAMVIFACDMISAKIYKYN